MKANRQTLNVLGGLVLISLVAAAGARAQDDIAVWQPSTHFTVPVGISSQGFKIVPPTITLKAEGTDPDGPGALPVRYRTLVKPAIDAAGNPIRTPTEYNLHYQEVLGLDDPLWSPWQDYPQPPAQIEIPLVDLPDGAYYFASVQVLDADGVSSSPFGYQIGTVHLKVLDGFFRPEVALYEPFLGPATSSQMLSEIASGQPVNFSWTATAEAYGGEIVSYRHGWDLIAIDDPFDPGWAVPPGTSAQNLYAAERSFSSGMHTFTLRVEDSAGGVRIMSWVLSVVPFVSPEYQLSLLVLDQTVDANVNNWIDQQGNPRNSEDYRNPWWHFLAESNGVDGLNWDRDWRNHTDEVSFRDLVPYKAVLCYAEFNETGQRMFQQFRPVNGQDRYVWLTPYQRAGGNFFLVGGRSMDSFLEGLPNYMVPTIFDTSEETYVLNGQAFVVGFGETELPSGATVLRGPRQYPFATAGISALDWTSPSTKYIYARPVAARFDRTVDCVGLKGLVLDDAFRDYHLVGPGVIADTMWTSPEIDWHDYVDAAADTLRLFHNTFPFRADEFVDANISSRTTPIVPQDCDDGPNGACIQPMFRGIARYDYVREQQWAAGDTDWPYSRYVPAEIDDGCGPLALTDYEGIPQGSARTNGQVFGYMSYKTVADKPSGKADVYWGFDPYRFESTNARKAVRWVLQYFGLQLNP